MECNIYEEFSKWLDDILEAELPSEAAAIHFNLYEDEDQCWSVQLVAAGSFDKEGEDWACDEVFAAENLFSWKQAADWGTILEETADIIKKYLKKGQYAGRLKLYQGVGVGFVDGNIELLYVR